MEVPEGAEVVHRPAASYAGVSHASLTTRRRWTWTLPLQTTSLLGVHSGDQGVAPKWLSSF